MHAKLSRSTRDERRCDGSNARRASQLGRLRRRRPARPPQSDHARARPRGGGRSARRTLRSACRCRSTAPAATITTCSAARRGCSRWCATAASSTTCTRTRDHPDVFCDDAVLLYSQFSTHWDALAHVGSMFDADGDGVPEVRYYNGYRGGVEIGATSRRRSRPARNRSPVHARSASNAWPRRGLQGRGVLVDLRRAFGDARRAVSYDDLMRTLDAQRVERRDGRHPVPAHRTDRRAARAGRRHPTRTGSTTRSAISTAATSGCLRWIDDVAASRRSPPTTSRWRRCRPRARDDRHGLRAAARAVSVQARHAARRAVVSRRPRALAAARTGARASC